MEPPFESSEGPDFHDPFAVEVRERRLLRLLRVMREGNLKMSRNTQWYW